MRYLTAILGVLCFLVLFSDVAIARKHGATIAWSATKSAATCTSPCKGVYLIFEGPGSGKEDMTRPLASTTKLSFMDNEPKEGAYRNTTRCYVVRYQEKIRNWISLGESSKETCVSFQ